jgi:hypothetical protein
MKPSIPPEKVQEIATSLYAGNKIEAIKTYRSATGEDLKDSKDAVEEFERQLREASPDKFTKPAGKGCALLLLGVLTIIGFAAL